MKILFVHLLNNFTGSPRVLATFLSEYAKTENEIHLLTSRTDGALSGLKNVRYHYNGYRWLTNKQMIALLLLFSQMRQFFFVLFGKKYDCVYINTILPFGAAIAAKLRGMKIICHIHEFYPVPSLLQKVCVKFARLCAKKVIFVSDYLKNCYEGIFEQECFVVHNSVSADFHKKAQKAIPAENYLENKFRNKTIVLPCALKKYKGVFLFVSLAKICPEYNFLLVTSNSKSESDAFFFKTDLPGNLEIKNEVNDMEAVYEKASVVMNLSVPHGADRIIETFSMILIEAFEFKTPCIAPCYGGPLEIILDGGNGFLLETEDLNLVSEKLRFLLGDFLRYKSFAESAYKRATDFQNEKFVSAIKNAICFL